MLVHRRVTPSSMLPVPISSTGVERDNAGWRFLSKETTRWQGLGVEPPPIFISEVQCANHYTIAQPPPPRPPAPPCLYKPVINSETAITCKRKDELTRPASWFELGMMTQLLNVRYSSSVLPLPHAYWTLCFLFALRREKIQTGNIYILFDGLTYNTRGYFASCVVFFPSPEGARIKYEQWAKCPRV